MRPLVSQSDIKAADNYSLGASRIPLLLCVGFSVVGILVLLYDRFVAPTFSAVTFAGFFVIVIGYCVLSWHILQRGYRHLQIEEARARAEAGSKAKADFLATMSHEMRTPMNAIIGMTELALNTDLTADQRRYLETVKSSADSMIQVINDILDFSNMEAGKLDLHPEPFRLRQVVGESLSPYVAKAAAKNLDAQCHIARDVPDALNGDAVRLGRVLSILVENAIKFTEEGSIVINVQRESDIQPDSNTVVVLFSVTDTGIGIAQEKQPLIFGPFVQVDASSTRKYGGTGLGLSIASRVAERMGGRLWVKSTPGHGSTFYFTTRFNLEAVQSGGKRPPDRVQRSLQVLLAEDNPVNQRLAIELLELRGHAVKLAENGIEVLAALDHDSFDVVLMDVNMPKMDGFQTTAAIREREKTNGGHLPIVAVTGSAMHGDRERCLKAGMDAYLCKPIRSKELFEAVEQATSS